MDRGLCRAATANVAAGRLGAGRAAAAPQTGARDGLRYALTTPAYITRQPSEFRKCKCRALCMTRQALHQMWSHTDTVHGGTCYTLLKTKSGFYIPRPLWAILGSIRYNVNVLLQSDLDAHHRALYVRALGLRRVPQQTWHVLQSSNLFSW